MKLHKVLSRANEVIKYLKTRGKRRLYTQWVEMAGLPREAVPEEIVGVHTTRRKEEKG